MRGDRMTFDKSKAAQIRQRLESKDDNIDHDYWNAHAAAMFPAMMDHMAELEAEVTKWITDRDSWIARYQEKAKQIDSLKGENTRLATIKASQIQILAEPGDAQILADFLALCKPSAFESPFPALVKRYWEALR